MNEARSDRESGVALGLAGKRGLVVGGGFGIGRAISRTLAACGVSLAIVERDSTRLSAICTELSAFGVNLDVAAEGAARRAIAEAREAIGPLDILVNVVGQGRSVPGIELTANEQLEMMKINYFHHVEFCSSFARACLNDCRPGVMTLASRPRTVSAAGCLRCGESRTRFPGCQPGRRTRGPLDPSQRCSAGRGDDRSQRHVTRGRRAVRQRRSARTARDATGRRQHGSLPVLRPLFLHYRPDTGHGWWLIAIYEDVALRRVLVKGPHR
jgi:hypothetical protein